MHDSGMIPFFAGIGIGIGIKNIKTEWNRNWNGTGIVINDFGLKSESDWVGIGIVVESTENWLESELESDF